MTEQKQSHSKSLWSRQGQESRGGDLHSHAAKKNNPEKRGILAEQSPTVSGLTGAKCEDMEDLIATKS